MNPEQIRTMRARIAELRTGVEAVLSRALAETRALTPEERTRVDADKAELAGLVSTLETAEEVRGLGHAPADPAAGPADGTRDGRQDVRVGEDREAAAPFTSFGEQLLAVRSAAVRPDQIDKRLLRLNAESRAATGLSEGVPSDGGFAVQTDYISSILGSVFSPDLGQLASRVERVPIGPNANGLKQNLIDESSRANGSRFGGVQVYWRAEADTVTATRPKLRQLSMELESLMGFYYATDELLEDSVALGSLAERAFSEEIRFKVEDGIWQGTGAGQILGVLNSPALVTQAIEATQTIANTPTFIATNAAKMLSRFTGNIGRAAWFINRELMVPLMTATLGGTSVPVYMPGGNIAGAPYGTLYGRPIVPIEYAAAQGTPGDIVLADMGWFRLIDKGGIKSAVSMHVRFLYAEQTFRVMYRLNGQPIPNKAITPYKGTATLSPFVALATRS